MMVKKSLVHGLVLAGAMGFFVSSAWARTEIGNAHDRVRGAVSARAIYHDKVQRSKESLMNRLESLMGNVGPVIPDAKELRQIGGKGSVRGKSDSR